MSKLHNRMPVILDRSTMWDWLDPKASPVALRALLVPYSEAMIAHPVSRLVNSPQNDLPDCIQAEKV
jgi:putative SOS response-associated peptidase YedK